MDLPEDIAGRSVRLPGLDVGWARSVLDYTTKAEHDLLSTPDRGQVEEALLADCSLDRSLVAWALGADRDPVLAGLAIAAEALVRVHELRATARAIPVEPGDGGKQDLDNSLDSPERARLAFHLAGLLVDDDLLARTAWPGGSAAESEALAALDRGDAGRFHAGLRAVVDGHVTADKDPRTFVSLPALGLAGRAVTARLATPDDLPNSTLVPRALLLA